MGKSIFNIQSLEAFARICINFSDIDITDCNIELVSYCEDDDYVHDLLYNCVFEFNISSVNKFFRDRECNVVVITTPDLLIGKVLLTDYSNGETLSFGAFYFKPEKVEGFNIDELDNITIYVKEYLNIAFQNFGDYSRIEIRKYKNLINDKDINMSFYDVRAYDLYDSLRYRTRSQLINVYIFRFEDRDDRDEIYSIVGVGCIINESERSTFGPTFEVCGNKLKIVDNGSNN